MNNRSPCLQCENTHRDKRKCSEDCADLKSYQLFLEQTEDKYNKNLGVNSIEDRIQFGN